MRTNPNVHSYVSLLASHIIHPSFLPYVLIASLYSTNQRRLPAIHRHPPNAIHELKTFNRYINSTYGFIPYNLVTHHQLTIPPSSTKPPSTLVPSRLAFSNKIREFRVEQKRKREISMLEMKMKIGSMIP